MDILFYDKDMYIVSQGFVQIRMNLQQDVSDTPSIDFKVVAEPVMILQIKS